MAGKSAEAPKPAGKPVEFVTLEVENHDLSGAAKRARTHEALV